MSAAARADRGVGRDAFEGKGPQRRPQKRLDRRLEEVAEAVGGGYCRLQMPLRLALGIRETVAGKRLGALEGGGGGPLGRENLPTFLQVRVVRYLGVIFTPSEPPTTGTISSSTGRPFQGTSRGDGHGGGGGIFLGRPHPFRILRVLFHPTPPSNASLAGAVAGIETGGRQQRQRQWQ